MQITSPDFVCGDCANGKVKAALWQKKSKEALLNSLFNQLGLALPVAPRVKVQVIGTAAYCVWGTWEQSCEHSHNWTRTVSSVMNSQWITASQTSLHLRAAHTCINSLLPEQLHYCVHNFNVKPNHDYWQIDNFFLEHTVRLGDLFCCILTLVFLFMPFVFKSSSWGF